MAASDKDTIYIDIDDEITGIIDKLRGSESKVVALVLPKRAAVFQSIVNMKLLKRAADAGKKNLVLITSEAGLLPLAGAAGVHVAKTLTSKPEIPAGPEGFDDSEEMVQEDDPTAETPVDPTKSVGQLAGGAAPVAADGVETLVLDDDDIPPEDAPDKPAAKDFKPPAKKGGKKLSIPNFERFRLLLILGGLLLIILIGFLIFASVSLPKATITIKTDATNVDANAALNLSTTATSLQEGSTATLPAKLASQQKTYTQAVPTTGQKNTGNKASGTVTITNCSTDNSDIEIPAGTGVSGSGQTYIMQSAVSLPFSGQHPKGSCQSENGVTSASVPVTAQSPGSSFNINSGASMTVAGYSNVSTTAGTISGGTDNIVQSVNQNDINGAKAKISTSDPTVKSALQSQLQQAGYYAVAATYTAGTPNVTSSANVGDVANNVTVTETVNYTMFGAHKSDLDAVLDDNIKSQIDTSKQSILDDGLSSAAFNVNNVGANSAQLSLSTKATAGPQLDINGIKQAAAGKKAGAIKSQLGNNPDVTSVDVKISPFWISSVTKKTSRITVIIAKPTTTAKASSSGNSP